MTMPAVTAFHSIYPRYAVLNVPLRVVTIPELVHQMSQWIERKDWGHCISFVNVHVVIEAWRDPQFHSVLTDEMSFNVPDGMPLVWLGRLRGFKLRRRVYGPDTMLAFCEGAARRGYRHFFYGGAPGVPERLAANLQRQFEGMKVVGMYSPPYRQLNQDEDEEVVTMINEARPDVLWLGLGCPKQEKWAFAHRSRLRVPIIASVGQAFDIHAGQTTQAPAWMRENGLEWLFRFVTNPRRLWKRYLVYNSQFIFLVAREWLGI